MNIKITPQNWSFEQKRNIAITCGTLDKNAIKALCLEQGIDSHQVKQWQDDFNRDSKENALIRHTSEMKMLKQENKSLKRKLDRKDKALSETEALLALQKRSPSELGQRRGRLTMIDERAKLTKLIAEARENGARQSQACEIVGLSARTLQRWELPINSSDGRLDSNFEPKNKLSLIARQEIIKVVNEPEHINMTPSKIVSKLAAEGRNIGSVSSFYRILKADKKTKQSLLTKTIRQIKTL